MDITSNHPPASTHYRDWSCSSVSCMDPVKMISMQSSCSLNQNLMDISKCMHTAHPQHTIPQLNYMPGDIIFSIYAIRFWPRLLYLNYEESDGMRGESFGRT